MAHAESDKSARAPEANGAALRRGMIALIVVPALAVVIVAYYDQRWAPQHWLMLCAVIVLSLFLPLLAYSYYFFRRQRREAEVDRMLAKLDLTDEGTYIRMFRSIRSGPYFFLAAGIAWVISVAGLMILFLGDKAGFENITLSFGSNVDFPKPGSRLIFGVAFLGAYLWGLQYTFRRYVVNDLIPGVFYSLSIRMIMAATLALLIFNAFESLAGGDTGGAGSRGFDAMAWPALAFLLGAFPQRGLQWLMARVPIFSTRPDPSVRPLPLEMIEGLQTYDRMRLEELGIESCHDLATYDFVPLVLKTSYGARQLTDWILQAKLCVCCGGAVQDLRRHGIRGLLDVADLDEAEIVNLAKETSATESSLTRAKSLVEKDPEIRRLRRVAGRLSEYAQTD